MTIAVFFGDFASELYGVVGGLVVMAVLQLAWRTTYVRDQRIIAHGTIVLVERQRAAGNGATTGAAGGAYAANGIGSRWRSRVRTFESRGNSTETEDIELDDHAATLEENVLSLAEHDLVDDGIAPLPFDLVDSEQHIINVMDAAIVHGPSTMATPSPSMPTTPVAPTPTPPLAPVVSGTDAEDAQHATEAQNCTNENIENEAGRLLLSTAAAPTAAAAAVAAASTATGDSQQQPPEAETGSFTVKLKYLNDDVRMANGTPNEPIGEFTKRHFAAELADNKSVRLIFNGQVLRPETKTLRACGMFADCVVHCLVRATPPSTLSAHGEGASSQQQQQEPHHWQRQDISFAAGMNNNNNNNNTTTTITAQLDSVQMFMAVSMIGGSLLTSAWYMRIQYPHLFSNFSTFGLTLLTVMVFILSWMLLRNNQRLPGDGGGGGNLAAPAAEETTDGRVDERQQQQREQFPRLADMD